MDTQSERQLGVDTFATDALKLLLPIDATERSRWGINYAIRHKQSGRNVAASLLYVAEPVTDWEVFRFLTQEEFRRFQVDRGNCLLQDAAQPLERAGIPAQTIYREGDIVFQILDSAEELACDEIVLPIPYPRWARLFSVDIVRAVVRRKRRIPVTTVCPNGAAERSWQYQ